MSTENKTENSKNSTNLLDMTATITLNADDCIAKLEHIESRLKCIGNHFEKIIELQKTAFGKPAEDTDKTTKTFGDDGFIKQTLTEQLEYIKSASSYEDHENLPQLTAALCEVLDRLNAL